MRYGKWSEKHEVWKVERVYRYNAALHVVPLLFVIHGKNVNNNTNNSNNKIITKIALCRRRRKGKNNNSSIFLGHAIPLEGNIFLGTYNNVEN